MIHKRRKRNDPDWNSYLQATEKQLNRWIIWQTWRTELFMYISCALFWCCVSSADNRIFVFELKWEPRFILIATKTKTKLIRRSWNSWSVDFTEKLFLHKRMFDRVVSYNGIIIKKYLRHALLAIVLCNMQMCTMPPKGHNKYNFSIKTKSVLTKSSIDGALFTYQISVVIAKQTLFLVHIYLYFKLCSLSLIYPWVYILLGWN